MPKAEVTRPDQPLRETEQAAYHAYREWPILLALRQKELAALIANPSEQDKPDKKEGKPRS
jgi:hypothetical protein